MAARPRSLKTLLALVAAYLTLSGAAGSMRLDVDEFTFVREPYELLGGDYTVGYLRAGEYGKAVATAGKAYYFYWKYRPLFSPIVGEADKALFEAEEKRFGYSKPPDPRHTAEKSESTYRKRLIVPEPDRFYAHGAGKPLLSAIANVPALALAGVATRNGPDLLTIQYRSNYHPVFILVKLAAILAGLATLVLVYLIAEREWGRAQAAVAGALFLAYPPVLMYFPNIHHDAYMVPFLVGAAYAFVKQRYGWAGISYGLALAAKNTAIFLAPAIVAFLVWKWWRGALPAFRQQAQGLLLGTIACFVVLLPFAHPVSYVDEILTPVTDRAYDPRGEDVSQFLLKTKAGETGESGRGSVRLLQRVLPWSAFLGLVLLGVVVCGPRLRDDTVALSFFFLLMLFPYGMVFGQGLHYRSLMFVPFICLIAARLSNVRWCVPVIAVLALANLVVLADPLTAREMRPAVPGQTLMDLVLR